ncbi:MAG: hypothetical protein ACI9OT_002181, partial [Gammaproteobacteria bacterium]
DQILFVKHVSFSDFLTKTRLLTISSKQPHLYKIKFIFINLYDRE